VIESLDSSRDEIGGDELDIMEEDVEGKGKEELQGMPEDHYDSKQGIMMITDHAQSRDSPGWSFEHDQDFEIQNGEELDHVDADFSNIALMEREGANNPVGQEQKADQMDNVDVNW